MNPTIGIISADASRSSLPNAWVKACASSLQPRARMASAISSAVRFHAVDAVRRVEQIGQGDGAVERHPAHELRVQEVLRAAPDLPDPLVGLGPALRRRRRPGSARNVLGVGVAPFDHVGQPGGRAEQLAVDVELALVPGAVADADRLAVPPPGEVRELALGEVVLAPDAEHDLEIAAPLRIWAAADGGHEAEERVGLVRAGRHPEGVEGEAGVADPRVAVVPVAGARRRTRAARWWRRRRWRRWARTSGPAAPCRCGGRDDATDLRSAGAAATRIATWRSSRRGAGPARPGSRPGEATRRCCDGGARSRRTRRRRAVKHTVTRPSARANGTGRGEHHDVGPTLHAHAAIDENGHRRHQAVLGAGHELHGDVDWTGDPGDPADQQARRLVT